MPLNILIVSQYFWPENFGINDLAKGLVERGHRITVLTGRPNYPNGRFYAGYGAIRPYRQTYNGMQILRVPLFPRGRGGGFRLAMNYASFAFTASFIGPLLTGGKYDAIFVYEPSPITVGLPAMIMKACKGAPILFWLQDLWPESLSATGAVKSAAILKPVEQLVRWMYKWFDCILIQSRAFGPAVEQLGGNPRKIRYFPNGAESLYRPVAVPSNAPEHKLMPDGFRVTFAGNIGAAQDFDTIVEAARLLKSKTDIHWIIIGDGRMKDQVERTIQREGLTDNVHLLGRHPPERMPYFFSLSDALLVTLKKDPIFSLTIPSKVQAYLACGRPIVAALDGEGARVIQEANAGLTCSTQNPAGLAEAVLKLYGLSPDERAAMGKNGRSFFENEFEQQILLDRLERWLTELIRTS